VRLTSKNIQQELGNDMASYELMNTSIFIYLFLMTWNLAKAGPFGLTLGEQTPMYVHVC
jgi:hypothetical protein